MNKHFIIFILLVLLTLGVVGQNLAKPFVGIHDWNGARYGQIARNYLEKGMWNLRFGQLGIAGEYYTHYPVLLPILISISYKAFGVSEMATRLVPVIATSLSIGLIYVLVSSIFSKSIGVIAALAALFTPLVRYYGKNPVHEPLSFLFLLVVSIGTWQVYKHRFPGWKWIYIGLVLMGLTNWMSIFVLIGVIICLYQKAFTKQFLVATALVFLVAGLHFWHMHLLTGVWDGGGLLSALGQRTGIVPLTSSDKFTLVQYINQMRIWSLNMFTLTLLFLSLLGILVTIKNRNLAVIRLGIGLGVASWGHTLFFRNASYIHEYFLYGGLLFIIISASAGTVFLSHSLKLNIIVLGLIILIMVGLEKNRYVIALNGSSHEMLAMQLGKELFLRTSADELILVQPTDYAQSRQAQLLFYSQRQITADPNATHQWTATVFQDQARYSLTADHD